MTLVEIKSLCILFVLKIYLFIVDVLMLTNNQHYLNSNAYLLNVININATINISIIFFISYLLVNQLFLNKHTSILSYLASPGILVSVPHIPYAIIITYSTNQDKIFLPLSLSYLLVCTLHTSIYVFYTISKLLRERAINYRIMDTILNV